MTNVRVNGALIHITTAVAIAFESLLTDTLVAPRQVDTVSVYRAAAIVTGAFIAVSTGVAVP